jgi:hypothetical protein
MELIRRPSAFLPLAISVGFLLAFSIGLARGTLVRQPDEDAGAHLFQLLMPLQFLMIAFFAIRWLPRKRTAALRVLALQVSLAIAVLLVVYVRNL